MLTETKRRIVGIVMAGAIALSLSGCYTMKTANVYHADGTVDSSVLIAMDDSLLADQYADSSDPKQALLDDATSSPEMKDLQEQLGDRLTVESYAQDGQSGVLITQKGVTLEEVAKLNASQSAPAGDTKFTVADGKITLEYTADAKLMENYDEALSSLDEFGMDSSSLSEFVDFEARHTFPGPVISTTIGKIDPDDPNSVIITDMTEMNAAQEYTIVASDGSSKSNGLLLVVIAIVALVVLAGAAGVIVWRVRAARKSSVAPADGTLGDEAIAGVAPEAVTFAPEPTVIPEAAAAPVTPEPTATPQEPKE